MRNAITRTTKALAFLAVTVANSNSPTHAAAVSGEPLRIGSDKQLFIGPWAKDGRDAHLVASMKNVTMTMHEAIPTGERLFELDRPWEGKWIVDMRFTVLKDRDRFRLYYCAMPKHPKLWEEAHCRIVCYAESTDGIHWTKPNLGLWRWNGSRDNNILVPNDDFKYVFSEAEGCWVFIDPHAKDPNERYKMLLKIAPVRGSKEKAPMLGKGQYMFTAPDGIHWKLWRKRKINPGASDAKFSMFWDDRIGRYVVYSRMKRREKGGSFRFVGRMESEDFDRWSKEKPVIATDAIDLAGSSPGRSRVDVYDPHISKYTEAPNVYVALANMLYHWKADTSPRCLGMLPGTMDVQLVTSRDGVHWNRTPRRRPFVRVGPHGSFWSKAIWPNGSVIRVGDELWVYYNGQNVAHNKEQSTVKPTGTYTRAVLRLDGFISARAAYTGGELITRPLVFAGSKLRLNVNTGAGGTVRVEMQDASGKPIRGFTAADCDEINGNYIRVDVTWQGKPNLSALAGKPVRLRFVMRDTDLYSFQFVQPPR